MTKSNAATALVFGKKLTHPLFSGGWVKLSESPDYYQFNDNRLCAINIFWLDRQSKSWETGWEIINN